MNTVLYYAAINGIETTFPAEPSPSAAESSAAPATEKVAEKQAEKSATEAAGDDDFDVFGDVDEQAEEEQRKARAEAAQASKKKAAPVGKSNLILDVKPWEAETDLQAMEAAVRSIQMEGLTWSVSKLVEVAYGIKKLQISAVIIDDLISVDTLEEQIKEFDDLVQKFQAL
ncbi:Elongation factor 1-beta [Balamuthia mandrillaris]